MSKIKLKKQLIFGIGTNSIREESGEKMNEKIKEKDNNSNLSNYEKRIAILKEENSSIYISNSNNKNSFGIKDIKEVISKKENKPKFNIKIEELKKENDKNIEKECNKINDNISDFEKRILVLKSEKTTTFHIVENKLNINENVSNTISSEQNAENEERENEETVNQINQSSIADRPTADTSSQIENDSFDNPNSIFIQEKTNPNFTSLNEKFKTFNEAKQNYYLERKLYDILLKRHNTLQPEKYKLGHNQYKYAYDNNTNTYCITISKILNKNNEIKAQKDIIQDKNYYKSFGLCFCGKFIEEFKMKCAPNQFMCKECMKINKAQYNLDKNYLINMNGRVAKMHKGSYYCYGLFTSDFKTCGIKFTCKSCNLLNLYSKYYSS